MARFSFLDVSRAGCAQNVGSVNDHLVATELTLRVLINKVHVLEGSAPDKHTGVAGYWAALRFDGFRRYVHSAATVGILHLGARGVTLRVNGLFLGVALALDGGGGVLALGPGLLPVLLCFFAKGLVVVAALLCVGRA